MKTIMLVCTAGMSTSLLVSKVRSVVEKRGLAIKVISASQSELKSKLDQIDLLLLGPQVKYLYNNLEQLLKPQGKEIAVIDSISYGTLDGEAVLEQALELLKTE